MMKERPNVLSMFDNTLTMMHRIKTVVGVTRVQLLAMDAEVGVAP